MSDFDTRRVGEIAMLEDRIRTLQDQLRDSKKASDKWEPRVSSESSLDQTGGRVTVAFGGKTLAVTIPITNLQNGDVTTNTTSVLEVLAKTLLSDQLRPIITPEVERLVKNAQSLSAVGKW